MTLLSSDLPPGVYRSLARAGTPPVSAVGDDGTSQLLCDATAEQIAAAVAAFSLPDYIAERRAECDAHARQLRDAALASVSPFEAASWPLKIREAQAVAAGGTDAPMLALEASQRGVSLQALAQRVMANAAALAPLEAVIAGVCGRHRDALAECATWQQVRDYDITEGWPQV